MSYDALLLVSFGGPEGLDDVMPFLENVTRGRNIPRERLLAVAEHYRHFGGISPINEANRALIAALERELANAGIALPIYWGNRNWHPFLEDTVRQMRSDGVQRALALVTSAFSSYSGCRQYREDLARAREAVGVGAPSIDKVRVYFDHPGFLEAQIDRVKDALAELGERASEARLVFTAHSIPLSMERGSPYVAQLREASALVARGVGHDAWELVWQSRSGPPQVPWLEPDVLDHMTSIAADGRPIVIVPIGFTSDHMEVVWDLDHEARQKADELGIPMARAKTVGTHPRFVAALRELIEERTRGGERRSLSVLGSAPGLCSAECCPAPARPAR